MPQCLRNLREGQEAVARQQLREVQVRPSGRQDKIETYKKVHAQSLVASSTVYHLVILGYEVLDAFEVAVENESPPSSRRVSLSRESLYDLLCLPVQ